MPLLVTEVGAVQFAGISSVVQALRNTRKPSPLRMLAAHDSTLSFRPAEGEIDDLLRQVLAGNLKLIRLEWHSEPAVSAMVFPPHFEGERSQYWTLVIDSKPADAVQLFSMFLAIDTLRYISISVEEAADMPAEPVSTANFPWNHPSLVLGAVHSDSGWIVRHGASAPVLLPAPSDS